MVHAIWKPSDNWGSTDLHVQGRDNLTVQGMCWHGTAVHGTPERLWDTRPLVKDRVSATFYITRTASDNGQFADIYQLVAVDNVQWSNGPTDAPNLDNPFVNRIIADGINPNFVTIGVENEIRQKTGEYYTQEQILSSAVVLIAMQKRFGFLLDLTHNTGHSDWTDTFCPGPHWPREAVVSLARQHYFDDDWQLTDFK